MVNLQYDCFDEFVREIFLGCTSREDLPKIKNKYVKTMMRNSNDIWVKVTDQATGKIIAASNWRLYINGVPPNISTHEVPEWLAGGSLETANKFIKQFNEVRAKSMPGPFMRGSPCDMSFLCQCAH